MANNMRFITENNVEFYINEYFQKQKSVVSSTPLEKKETKEENDLEIIKILNNYIKFAIKEYGFGQAYNQLSGFMMDKKDTRYNFITIISWIYNKSIFIIMNNIAIFS